ncbi:MAG TPA: M3 family metallopeptidase [Steroidobacteraceae bacterium]|nr:M3 family metallopeptidase [Steroidobacteraceae bacterium]
MGFAVLGAVALPLLAAPQPAPPAAVADALHAWAGGDDPAALDAWVHAHMRRADAQVARLLTVKGSRTVPNTLRAYDEAVNELTFATVQSSVLYGVGATAELRDKAQALTQTANAALTALSLNQPVYRALAALPAPGDAATRHYLEHTLLEYRLAGVDKDDATRAKIKALQERITELGLKFERAVHDDVRSVVVDKGQLAGLPPDYLAAHPPDAQGHVKITTDPPDAWPAQKFADSVELRHKLFLAAESVAYPANTDTLRGLLQARADLAQLLGYATWADFAMADQMIGSPAKLHDYLGRVDAASRDPAMREDAALLAFARTRDAALHKISAADARYWQEQYRRAKFNFDSQSVRPYFPYAAVERGVIATASRLFHVDIRPAPGVRTWHPSVTSYDVYDGDRKLGRVYLDMHPRAGKDKWFSTQPLSTGVLPGQLPEGTLVCNFPGGGAGDPGLMQYSDVVIFLHEFGHLMHHVIGGQQRYAGEGGFNVEGDFIEAPSQMLEEFFHDYGVLTTFAHHYQSGAALPRELYERMNRADTYGRASGQQRQLMYAAISLDFHTLPPATLDFDGTYRRDFERYNTFAFVPGDHLWASFTHLNGYSSNYYTYVLDKVIALDFFAQFDPHDLLGGPTGMRYRQTVLAPGATRPAAQLVSGFLGREPNLDAYRRWMLAEFAGGRAGNEGAATPAKASSAAH